MTAGDHRAARPVDMDLLADYAGGALQGTPQQRQVAELVDTDPRWRHAFDELRSADALVRGDLARLAPEPMPADVADRLHAALAAGSATARHVGTAGDTGAAGPVGPTPDRPAQVVSLAARRRRRYRIAAAAAVAAGVLAIGLPVGYNVLVDTGATGDKATEAGAGTEQNGDAQSKRGEAPAAAPNDAPYPVTASGRDYTRKTLPRVRGERLVARGSKVEPPAGLSRLGTPEGLRGCLARVTARYPGRVKLVDYASFEGSPAVVIVITASGNPDRIVVVGPDCGRSGTDEKYTTTVA